MADVGAVQPYCPLLQATVFRQQTNDCLRGGGFAGTGLADQRHHFPRLNGKRHLMHHPLIASRALIGDRNLFQLQYRWCGARPL
ncbi:hypothetical protein D3C87_2084960 [compost metagenome]